MRFGLVAILALLLCGCAVIDSTGRPVPVSGPRTISWVTLDHETFGGPAGQPAPKKKIVLQHWVSNAEAGLIFAQQENGVAAAFQTMAPTFILRRAYATFRATLEVIFPASAPVTGDDGGTPTYLQDTVYVFGRTVGRMNTPFRRGIAVYENQAGGKVDLVTESSDEAAASRSLRIEVTVIDGNATVRVDDDTAATFHPTDELVTAGGATQLDGLRLDVPSEDAGVSSSVPPTGGPWSSVSIDDFGGPGGQTSSLQTVQLERWSSISGNSSQENGYLLAPFGFAARESHGETRVSFDVLFDALPPQLDEGTAVSAGVTLRAGENGKHYADRMGVARLNFPSWRGVVVASRGCTTFLPDSGTSDTPRLVRVAVSFRRDFVVIATDGIQRCAFPAFERTAPRQPVFQGWNSRIDRLELETRSGAR